MTNGFSFDISVENKEKLMELLAPDGVETIYIEKTNGDLFPVANIERHPDCPKPIYEAWKRSLLQDGQKNHLTVEDIKTILDISFWNDDPEKILEEYNRLCDTSKVTPR